MHSVLEFHVCGDGRTRNTVSIQKAVDFCAEEGTVLYFPKGTYLTGTIHLKTNSHILLAGGAVIAGSTEISDYDGSVTGCVEAPSFNLCLFYAQDAQNICLEGDGTIDGQGAGFTPDCRPMLLRFVNCSHIRFSNLHFRNAGSWCCHMIDCQDIAVQNLRLYSRVQVNNDGLDLDGCSNVRITGCWIDSGDDSICLKSTTPQICQNITVSGCTIRSSTAAIKFGTSSRSGFRNICITGCALYQCTMGAIKLLAVDGGGIENVVISGITMQDVGSPLFLRIGKRNSAYAVPEEMSHDLIRGTEDSQVCKSYIRHVIVSDVCATVTVPQKERAPIMLAGLSEQPIEDLTLSNLTVCFPGGGTAEDARRKVPDYSMCYPEQFYFGVLPAWGLYARHVRRLTVQNVNLTLTGVDCRPVSCFEDVRQLQALNTNCV